MMQATSKAKLNDFFENLINLIYPPNCILCKRKLNSHLARPLCLDCFRKIKILTPPFCVKCGKAISSELIPHNICIDCKNRRHYFDRAWASANYEGVIRECIHLLKYGREMSLVNLLSRTLIDFSDKYMDMKQFDYILPIPLHRVKLREREFNQAQLLAKRLAEKFGKKLLSKDVYRTKYTLPQSKLTPREREENIRDAFGLRNPAVVREKNILIIDDIFTTGATVNECASLLKKNGSSRIEVLTLAR